jgi:hypothetical protein
MLFIRYFRAPDSDLCGGAIINFWLRSDKLKCLWRVISLIVLSVVAQGSMASIVETQCGGLTFQIKISGKDGLLDTVFRTYSMYYITKNHFRKLFFKTQFGIFLYATCIKNKNNDELFVFNEYPGGNVAPEDMYSVFDPKSKKMLVQRKGWDRGNSREVEQVLGAPPPVFNDDDGTFFCCFRRQF